MMLMMSANSYASRRADSLMISRIWAFGDSLHEVQARGAEQNIYLRYTFGSPRRNATLMLVPTMHSIARGERQYIGESYCKMKFHDRKHYDLQRQVVCGTIPRNRISMSAMLRYITPDIYGVSIYSGSLLSPLHRENRYFYKYRVEKHAFWSMVSFRPRVNNTQLVRGTAMVETQTGRVISISFGGEFDMVKFQVETEMGTDTLHQLIPMRCTTKADFRFLGNKVSAVFSADYDCPTTLPDSISERDDRLMMDSLRPRPLTDEEAAIYTRYQALQSNNEETANTDTVAPRKGRMVKDVLWDVIGDNLISSTHANAGAFSMSLSPLLNPLYLGYSRSRGISYKLRAGLQYTWNSHRYMTFSPQFGYNLKLRQFYYELPLRMNYNPKRHGYVEWVWANGNHTSNSSLVEDIQRLMGADFEVPEYKDETFSLTNNIAAFDWLEITTGIVYHRRQSTNAPLMRQIGIAEEFRSLAPSLSVHLTPWSKGPTMTVNFEHAIDGVMKTNMGYDRWEIDASHKRKFGSLRIINWRAGTGFYTRRKSNYFIDFSNFHDNNLPSGWEDDWSGQFQLLDSRWYNESNYYLRGHVSFDTPLLALGWTPLVGHFIETERIYVSTLSIERTRLYSELGYGFTNRFFSTGIFASFLGSEFQKIGCKFTIELFRRW